MYKRQDRDWRRKNVSDDGRWLVRASGKRVQLVDLNFKKKPRENRFRIEKAKPNAVLHKKHAQIASNNNDLFAEVFHLAWLAKSLSTETEHQSDFEEAYAKLTAQLAEQNKVGDWRYPEIANELIQSMKMRR